MALMMREDKSMVGVTENGRVPRRTHPERGAPDAAPLGRGELTDQLGFTATRARPARSSSNGGVSDATNSSVASCAPFQDP